jgi:type I restriction enzyme S subunit
MNADRLLAHFEKISEAPDAVDRLRRFVLDLAVRGKLVEQNPGESTEPSEAPTADEPFPLPSNWSCVALGGILHMINGRAFKPSDWLGKGLPIVRIQNLNNVSAPFNCCDPKVVDEKNIIESGTFLISWSGTPGTSFGAFIWQRGRAALNQHIFKCLPTGTEYLDRFLQLAINGRLDEMIAKAHGGVGLQHITKGKLEALALPLPPLAEQHRIVAKVDELMLLCDRLEASQSERETRRDRLVVSSLNQLGNPSGSDPDEFKKDAGFHLRNLNRLSTKPEHIKELRKAILNLAVRGMLVPQDEKEGTADALLRQITAQMPPKKDPGEEKQGDVARWTIPPAWRWTQMKCLCSRVTSGATPSKDVFQESSGVPFLKVYNIRNQQIDFGYKPQFISRSYHETKMKRSTLQPGDVVMNIVGPPLGKVAIIPGEYPEWNCNQAIAVFKLVLPELAPYVYWFLRENSFLDKIELIGTAGQDNISVTKSQNIPIPLPPLAEQKRIVAKVDALMAICDHLEKQLESQQKESRRLLEALLHEALEGVG